MQIMNHQLATLKIAELQAQAEHERQARTQETRVTILERLIGKRAKTGAGLRA